MQRILGKLLLISHVLVLVQEHQVGARVRIKHSLLAVGGLLDVLFPLGFKELKDHAGDYLWIFSFKMAYCCDTLLEFGVGHFSRDRNSDWCLLSLHLFVSIS